MTKTGRAVLAILVCFLPLLVSAQAPQPEMRSGIWRGMNITYAWMPGVNGGGKNVYQGDIVLDHVLESPNAPGANSFGIAYSQYLWPKVGRVFQIPFVIDPASGDLTSLTNAISQFNSTFSGVIQFVARNAETDYVSFKFDNNDQSGVCDAFEGRVGGEQVVGGSGACTVATILHEMGHTLGVWHEQTRPDRDAYVAVNYNAVIKASRSNFDLNLDDQQQLGPYDYASVMEYPSFSFSRNGEPCIETIPAGIPLSNQSGYSAADVDGILRLYGAIPTPVTVTSNPPGLQVVVDGSTIITPMTFAWPLNSTHTLNVPSTSQTLAGISYIYGRWNDSILQSHTITVTPGNNMVTQPATSPAVTVYSANFKQLVKFTNTISPASAGSVTASPAPVTYSGVSGQYFLIRQPVTLNATPAIDQNFYNYINAPFWLPGANGANPKTFYVMDDGTSINLTTYFTSSPVYAVTTNPLESNHWVVVDGAFLHSPANFALPYDSAWTPSSSHSLSTYTQYPWSSNTRFEFSSWSDGGSETHNVTLPSSGGATYTASIVPQYYVADWVQESCAGSINVSPASPSGDGFYPNGSLVSFAQTPNAGWIFTGWLYDLGGTASPQNLTVNDEVLVASDYSTTATRLQLSSLSPATIAAGGGAFTLTINGAGFTASTAAYINGAFRAPTFVNSTELAVAVTAADIATPGAFQVAVGNFPSGAACAAYVPLTFYVLLGSGVGTPSSAVAPKTLAFGNVAVGTTSSTKSVTLTNPGTGPLTIGSITASGDFAQTNNCSGALAANSSCTVNVTFTPNGTGAITGALTFTDSATTSPQVVKMTGTGLIPLSFSPASLTFPSTAVGQTSSATATVTNKLATAVTLGVTATSDYAVTGGSCGSTLNAGTSCTIITTFTPQYKGSIKGALQIATNAAFSPQIIGLAGTATGGPAVPLSLTPATLTFLATGIGATSAPKVVTVTNKSLGPVTISGISASANYSVVGGGTSPCGGALAKSASCTLSVTFIPSGTGSIKGTVAVADSGPGSPQIVGLSGTGAIPVVLTPASLTFTAQAVGTTSAPKVVTLTNNSGSTLTISSIVASGDFSTSPSGGSPCSATVGAGSTCTLSVTFTPNIKGAISGATTVIHGAPLSPAVIKLAGTGQ